MWVKMFGLSYEDTQNKDDWRLRIKEAPADPGLPGKWLLNGVHVSKKLL